MVQVVGHEPGQIGYVRSRLQHAISYVNRPRALMRLIALPIRKSTSATTMSFSGSNITASWTGGRSVPSRLVRPGPDGCSVRHTKWQRRQIARHSTARAGTARWRGKPSPPDQLLPNRSPAKQLGEANISARLHRLRLQQSMQNQGMPRERLAYAITCRRLG